MSPLLLVGILTLSTALADVKHVLEGSAHPPTNANAREINGLAVQSAFQSGNPRDFWWMASNSPLKDAYDHYKKCTEKGDCLPSNDIPSGEGERAKAGFATIDIKSNPFLNGAGVSAFGSSSSSSANGFSSSSSVKAFHSGSASIDVSKNPFLNGQAAYATAGNGDKIKSDSGFLGVQPKKQGFPTSHPLSNKAPCATSPAVGQQSFVLGGGAGESGAACSGQGYACVAKYLCVNGVVSEKGKGKIRSDSSVCDVQNEVCCKLSNAVSSPVDLVLPNNAQNSFVSINNLADISAGKSSVPGSTIKFTGGQGSSPGQIHVLLDSSQINSIGESGSFDSSTSKPVRDVTYSSTNVFPSTVDYSNVQFDSNVRFASTIQGPAYLPPLEATTPGISTYQPSIPTTPRPSCPPGSYLGSYGQCETPRPPPPTPRPCPPGTFLTASGQCEAPRPPPSPSTTPRRSCPCGTYLTPSGQCEAPRPPPSPSTTPRPSCPPGTFLGSYGQCETPRPPPSPSTTPRPSCPPGTFLGSYGQCETPRPPPPSPTPRPCPPGTYLVASGQCEAPRPPPSTLRPACPPGTFLGSYGQCESPRPSPSTTPKPSCPPGTFLGPYGQCETPRPPSPSTTPRPSCPPGTFLGSYGQCETPRPPPPAPKPACPPGTYLGASGNCERPSLPTPTPGYDYPKPSTTPRPQCPFGTYPSPSGACTSPSRPKPPPRPFEPPTTSREYLPPVTPTQPTTPRPNPSDGYVYEKPTPTFGYPSTPSITESPNSINNQYVPAPTTPKQLPPPEETDGSSINNVYQPDKPTTDNSGSSANNQNVFVPPTRQPQPNGDSTVPVGCAAALKCVQEIYCTAEGFVSPVPVVLTKEQELLRAPTTECKDLESGIIGKCCRDPNYKDPWPSANLVNGFDDGQYKEDNFFGQKGLAGNRLARASNSTRTRKARTSRQSRQQPIQNQDQFQGQQSNVETCGGKNFNTKPVGPGPIDANFAEYPWQAMILRDSNRSLLCGGTIIKRNAVLTSAHCLDGLDTNDVLIKGGEWKLGIDEEPLPFQIVKVGVIVRHPGYKAGSFQNDLALLILRENLRPSKNIGTICLPEANHIPTKNCIATGWGKRILQLHAKGAIMHHIGVKIMDSKQCQATLTEKFQEALPNYSPNTLCGFSEVDQCKVDYGSALACENEQGQHVLSGIYSWDTGCKQEGQIGGYVAPDVAWLASTMAKSIKELKKLENEFLLSSRVL